mmetsp:Transcript_19221/g.37425  ORF Transcript_19221/g.37425 Transcript_19221/m.37425 type:complete len:205 (+) Transcript_19221:562-1176(+)
MWCLSRLSASKSRRRQQGDLPKHETRAPRAPQRESPPHAPPQHQQHPFPLHPPHSAPQAPLPQGQQPHALEPLQRPWNQQPRYQQQSRPQLRPLYQAPLSPMRRARQLAPGPLSSRQLGQRGGQSWRGRLRWLAQSHRGDACLPQQPSCEASCSRSAARGSGGRESQLPPPWLASLTASRRTQPPFPQQDSSSCQLRSASSQLP